jgi:ferredoxin
MMIVSFVLTNKNWFMNETINILIHDASGMKQHRMTLETKNGASYTFNVETMGWDWADYDVFAIVNRRGKVLQQWQCRLSEERKGVCHSCRGTQKCSACNGEGYWLDEKYHIQMCNVCNGTGICQHCYVPTRQNTIQNMGNVAPTQRKTGRSIAAIQADIRKTEFELDRVNKMLLQYELRQDYGLFYRNQKQYALKLEHRITDLYNEMSRSV